MLCIIRVIIIIIYCIVVCVFGSIYCLYSPRNPKHVATFGHIFGYLAPLIGLRIEIRKPYGAENFGNAIYIANHQNNYDMITAANVVQPPTVTIGKKSLIWIPIFGLLYWLTGNILIDRSNNFKAYKTIEAVIDKFKKCNISIWIFPEGTRNYGRGLLPFKTGAFYVAIKAGVPIIPVCVSNISKNKINLNRFNNGLVIIEMLPPIETNSYKKNQIHKLMIYCHELMVDKINLLNKEVLERENIK